MNNAVPAKDLQRTLILEIFQSVVGNVLARQCLENLFTVQHINNDST